MQLETLAERPPDKHVFACAAFLKTVYHFEQNDESLTSFFFLSRTLHACSKEMTNLLFFQGIN